MAARSASIAALGVLLVALASCGKKAEETKTTPTVAANGSGLRMMSESGGAPTGLTVHPGDIILPTTLSERTILEAAMPSISSSPGVIGSVVDVYGTASNGECRVGKIHVSAVSPGTVLKSSVVTELKAASQVHFNDIVEKQTKAETGYLGFSASMEHDDRCEILIEDIAEQYISNFDNDVDSTKLNVYESRPLPAGACGRYVITRLALTAIKYRTYTSKEYKAGVESIVKIGGRKFYSHTKVVNDLILGVVLRPIGYAAGSRTTLSPQPPEEVHLVR